jgi:hypothetical protein
VAACTVPLSGVADQLVDEAAAYCTVQLERSSVVEPVLKSST